MPPRTRAGAGAGGDDGDDESTLLSIVEMNKLFKDVVMFTPQSGVHDTNKALFRAWTRSIMLHAPVLEIVGRHAKADFGDIYDDEWAKIDQSERPQAAHMLAYFLKTKTAATAGAQIELMTWRNLKMIYVRAVAPQPAPAGLSAAAVSEPPWPGPQPRVETMEIFAGSGSMSRALRDSGASVVATCENDPRKAGALAHNLPGVHNYGDIHDDAIVGHEWNPRSVSAVVECGDARAELADCCQIWLVAEVGLVRGRPGDGVRPDVEAVRGPVDRNLRRVRPRAPDDAPGTPRAPRTKRRRRRR